jgi:hypothetical protein
MPMSPVSRGRKGKKTRRNRDLALVKGMPEACDCPACSGEDVDPTEMLDELLRNVETVTAGDDAFDAELAGALFVAVMMGDGADMMPIVVEDVLPQIEAKRNSAALSVLLAIASVASEVEKPLATAASAAADRLVAAGVPRPAWADQLAEPVRVGDCLRLYDTEETTSVLVVPFRRGEHGCAFLIMIHEMDYGGADILLLDEEYVAEALDDLRAGARGDGLDMRTQTLKPAELRWYAEQALDALAADETGWLAEPAWSMSEEDDDEGPPRAALAVLLRHRLADLPKPRKPAGARPYLDLVNAPTPTALTALAKLLLRSNVADPFGGLPMARPAPAKLPPKRKKSKGRAPIYQIKVGLRDAKPPIWRRLLIPADVTLDRLHDVLQAAFGWNDSHIHAFDTPYGEFAAQPDEELGHRAEAPVTLEQVAPRANEKIRYTYDFGDNWVHDIVVEKVLDRESTLTYPRCVGGRRATPPDDCGGIWGYQELIEIIGDPRHPEHQERLWWLGLDDPRQFDPAAFDMEEVNELLLDLR